MLTTYGTKVNQYYNQVNISQNVMIDDLLVQLKKTIFKLRNIELLIITEYFKKNEVYDEFEIKTLNIKKYFINV